MSYIDIDANEIHSLFNKSCWERGVSGKEVVYDYTMSCGVVVRVCTSLREGDVTARSKGRDAIRVLAFNPNTKKGVRKSVRVYRTPGWSGRVKKKVQDMMKSIKGS